MMEIHIHVGGEQYSQLADQLKGVHDLSKFKGKIPFRKKDEEPNLDPRSLRIDALAEALRRHEEFMEMLQEAQGQVSSERMGNATGANDVTTGLKDVARSFGH